MTEKETIAWALDIYNRSRLVSTAESNNIMDMTLTAVYMSGYIAGAKYMKPDAASIHDAQDAEAAVKDSQGT